jgi:hypothetical protein
MGSHFLWFNVPKFVIWSTKEKNQEMKRSKKFKGIKVSSGWYLWNKSSWQNVYDNEFCVSQINTILHIAEFKTNLIKKRICWNNVLMLRNDELFKRKNLPGADSNDVS